ncbi:MAG: hypothetical protein ACI35R_08690 [Bacillus sp. (in: firmicutes)]
MRRILETERIYLREMPQNDFDGLCEILQGEEVKRVVKQYYNREMPDYVYMVEKGQAHFFELGM